MLKDIAKIQEFLNDYNIDAFLITGTDPHGSEYTSERYKAVEFFSSFTGEGNLLITKNESLLWTDSRYFIQAAKELKESGTILMKMFEDGVPSIYEYLKKYSSLAVDAECLTADMAEKISINNKKLTIISAGKIINKIWDERPSMPSSQAFIIDDEDAGESTENRISKIRYAMDEYNVDYALLTSLDDIGWVFNMRGTDIPYNMVNYSFALISKDKATLYMDRNKLGHNAINVLTLQNIELKPYLSVYDDISEIDSKIMMDPSSVNYRLLSLINKPGFCHPFITSVLKARKNDAEIKNIKAAHLEDAAAVIRFIKYVKENAGNDIDEISLGRKLHSLRKASPSFIEESFETICAYKENAAIVHYTSKPETNKKVEGNGMLLVDSGAHYKFGTTDITRTIVIGKISEKEKHDFTLALKAHISLEMLRFNDLSTGADIDKAAREPLLKEGKNFGHGTGHGVGYMLCVHEGPMSISPRAKQYPFTDRIVTSIEPGLYFENEYGVRHENLALTVSKEEGINSFEPLTLVPFDIEGIDKNMLDKNEIEWLNEYHKKVYEAVSPALNDEEKEYLKKATRKI
ncbi:MAG: aminopeptidase P family N-terminal domain-containing protein [Clostridia bacterium]|nr:aminopeptidase P family N-terminal domain-containing protein [Clostridia bacterium]